MRLLLVTIALGFALATAAGRDVEVNASGISVPFFDANGKLTRRLTARHGSKAGELQKLREVELVYFSPRDAKVIVQKLVTSDATWDAEREVLTGTGKMLLATEQNRVTGEGFDFTVATSLLHIHEHFRMENAEVVVTSDRATVELSVERTDDAVKVRDVKSCEAIGHLQIDVQPSAKRHYDFVRAYSERAIYDGATQRVELPQEIRYVRSDGTEAHSNRLTIDLAPKRTAPP